MGLRLGLDSAPAVVFPPTRCDGVRAATLSNVTGGVSLSWVRPGAGGGGIGRLSQCARWQCTARAVRCSQAFHALAGGFHLVACFQQNGRDLRMRANACQRKAEAGDPFLHGCSL